MSARESACGAECLAVGGTYSEHVRELTGGHLDTDAGEEPDQDGAGQEVRQEPEAGQPRQQQQPTCQQGHQSRQLHVSRRPRDRESGEGCAEDRCGRGVGADHEVT